MLLQKKALILSTENDMQRGHYDVEQRHKTAIKQLQYRYKKNFGRCNNLTMRLWANSGSSPVRTAKTASIQKIGAVFLFILFLPYRRAIRTKHIHTQSCTLASRKTDIKTPAKNNAKAQSLFCPRFRGGFQTGFLRAKNMCLVF